METVALDRRFMVVAPVGRDGDLICGLLTGCGYAGRCVPRIADSASVESAQLLGLILTDEALAGDGIDALLNLVQRQPAWSDLPVMLLTSGPAEPQYAAVATARAWRSTASLCWIARCARNSCSAPCRWP